MSAAVFVLAINLFVAGLFATAFGIVAATVRSATGARWLAAGYGLGILDIALEFMLPAQADPAPAGIAIFVCFLLALSCWIVGLARHYRVALPYKSLGTILLVSLVGIFFIIDMPRTSLLRAGLYQLPYFALHLVGVHIVHRAGRRQALDRGLAALLLLSGLQYPLKPALAAWIGSGASPQAYIGSTYAAVSQSLGAISLIALGLTILLVIMRDLYAETTARAETDTLSGLLNRRGFEDRAEKALQRAQRAGLPAVLVTADLDHFKRINDSYGHAVGDEVIRTFARILRESADDNAIIGRLGGEEFVTCLCGANLATGRLYAETVRAAFASLSFAALGVSHPISGSFGVAAQAPGASLSELFRHADTALYRAKSAGRNRVVTAPPDPTGPATAPARRKLS